MASPFRCRTHTSAVRSHFPLSSSRGACGRAVPCRTCMRVVPAAPVETEALPRRAPQPRQRPVEERVVGARGRLRVVGQRGGGQLQLLRRGKRAGQVDQACGRRRGRRRSAGRGARGCSGWLGREPRSLACCLLRRTSMALTVGTRVVPRERLGIRKCPGGLAAAE
jgi:hypothetical protein